MSVSPSVTLWGKWNFLGWYLRHLKILVKSLRHASKDLITRFFIKVSWFLVIYCIFFFFLISFLKLVLSVYLSMIFYYSLLINVFVIVSRCKFILQNEQFDFKTHLIHLHIWKVYLFIHRLWFLPFLLNKIRMRRGSLERCINI